MGAQHQEYALCWTAHPQVAWLGSPIIGKQVAWFCLGSAAALPGSTPQCQAQCLCTACCRHLELCLSQPFCTHSPLSWSLGHNASVPGTYESETRLSTKEKTKKVRVYYPDSIFIFWQLLMVITPGNQKNEGHYMRRDFRERRRLKTKVEAAQHLMIGS